MTAMRASSSGYLESLLAGQPRLPPSPLGWLNRLRAHAVDRAGALTVPTAADEEWRFTDLSPLTRRSFQPVQIPTRLAPTDVERFFLDEAPVRLVFVDGAYAAELSSPANERACVAVNLPAALEAHAASLEPHLGRHALFEQSAFTALNTAFLHDGAVIVVPRNARAAAPVHLLFISTRNGSVSHPRCLVVAGAGSELTLVEDYVALHEESSFTNAVTEIALADQARVTQVRVQRESGAAFHIANCSVALGRASRYRSVSVTLGARLSRLDLNVVQAAECAECAIDGVALIGGEQLADTHTLIDHAKPHGVSRQLHKCIAGGSSHAVFNGKILVRAGAQQTDSSQSSRNLLLSGKAQVDTKPQLEIFADDVKCAHGATVGQLEPDEVFYLRSRGLSEATARNLLTYAFGAEVIERIPLGSLKTRLEQAVLERTSGQ